MTSLVEEKRDEIGRVCQRCRVRRLELFGSAAGGDFNPGDSDLDFLVEFLPLQPGEHADTYFDLLEALETLFECHVDLVMVRAVRNPYFLEVINRNRVVLYAA